MPSVVSTRYTRPSNIPAVKARPCGSPGISLTSIVPGAVGDADRAEDPPLLEVPDADRAAQLGIARERRSACVTGLMKSLVTIRLSSGRAEMPCGLKPSGGGVVRPLLHQVQVLVELGDAPGRPAGGRAHLRHQESPAGQRAEIVGDAGLGRACGEEELRVRERPKRRRRRCRSGPRSRLSSPPQARIFLSAERWQWCGSLPTLPGGGIGTVLMHLAVVVRVARRSR